MVNDGGLLVSFKPATGEVIKHDRLKGALDKYFASPVAADHKVISGPAVYGVIAQTAKQIVDQIAAQKQIMPMLAEQKIIRAKARQDIIAAPAIEEIAAVAGAVQNVIA